jgi:hypothetical protein
MTIPFFSLGIALLYFGWLWHNGSATNRSEEGLLSQSAKDLNRTGETQAAQPAPVERVLQKPFSLRTVYAPPAGAAGGYTEQ